MFDGATASLSELSYIPTFISATLTPFDDNISPVTVTPNHPDVSNISINSPNCSIQMEYLLSLEIASIEVTVQYANGIQAFIPS